MPVEFADNDFVRRSAIASKIKDAMRASYAVACRQTVGEPDSTFLSRSRAFWEEYENVNRIWVPEDPVYSKVFTSITLNTTNSIWQILAGASGQFRILESFIGGEAAASAVVRAHLSRSAAGTGTAPTAYTPEKFNTRSPNAGSTVYGALSALVAWGTTQETLNTNPLVVHAFNAFGGSDRWVPQPGEELYFVNGEYVSLRSASGTSVCSGHVIFEEL